MFILGLVYTYYNVHVLSFCTLLMVRFGMLKAMTCGVVLYGNATVCVDNGCECAV